MRNGYRARSSVTAHLIRRSAQCKASCAQAAARLGWPTMSRSRCSCTKEASARAATTSLANTGPACRKCERGDPLEVSRSSWRDPARLRLKRQNLVEPFREPAHDERAPRSLARLDGAAIPGSVTCGTGAARLGRPASEVGASKPWQERSYRTGCSCADRPPQPSSGPGIGGAGGSVRAVHVVRTTRTVQDRGSETAGLDVGHRHAGDLEGFGNGGSRLR